MLNLAGDDVLRAGVGTAHLVHSRTEERSDASELTSWARELDWPR